jgi:hypothetical protein
MPERWTRVAFRYACPYLSSEAVALTGAGDLAPPHFVKIQLRDSAGLSPASLLTLAGTLAVSILFSPQS